MRSPQFPAYHKKQSVNNVQNAITNHSVNGASMLVNLCFQKENGPHDPGVLKIMCTVIVLAL
jgi:hypothetical protein